ncbi:MAG: hypothetical protein ACOCYT_00095 [Chloroflexota bacterium]
MSLTDEQAQDLARMRTAAQQREWTTLQDTFKRLIAELDPLIALSVVAPRVQAFVPRFRHYYPEAGWVEQLMLTVVSYASAPRDLPVTAINQFPSPGCGNFIMAVLDLARTVQEGHTVFERFSHVTNAAANAILADLQYTYFKNRPEVYAQLHDENLPEAERQQIQYHFWLNEIVSKRDTALWLNLADGVEAALERQ